MLFVVCVADLIVPGSVVVVVVVVWIVIASAVVVPVLIVGILVVVVSVEVIVVVPFFTDWSLSFDPIALRKAGLYPLTLLYSERPKLYTILAFLSVIGLNFDLT